MIEAGSQAVRDKLMMQDMIVKLDEIAKDADGLLRRGQFVAARNAIAAMAPIVSVMATVFGVKR